MTEEGSAREDELWSKVHIHQLCTHVSLIKDMHGRQKH